MPCEIFVFDHIAKCGGSTISTMFNAAGCSVLRFHPGGARRYEGTTDKLLLCGHNLFHNLPMPEGVLYFTLLRDPVEVFYSQRWGRARAFKRAVDLRWDESLALVRRKFAIDPARYHFVGALEKLKESAARLSELTGLPLATDIHVQQSNRPVIDYRRAELERALAPELDLWTTAMCGL